MAAAATGETRPAATSKYFNMAARVVHYVCVSMISGGTVGGGILDFLYTSSICICRQCAVESVILVLPPRSWKS